MSDFIKHGLHSEHTYTIEFSMFDSKDLETIEEILNDVLQQMSDNGVIDIYRLEKTQ